MLGYMANMEQVVTRLRLVHGCALTQLDFQSPEWTTPADYVNDLGSPPANGECAVFLQEGGALAWQAPPAILQVNGGVEYGISALIQVPGVGTDAGGGAGKELAVYARVPKDVCLAVNDKYGIPNPSGDPPGVSASLTIPAGLSAFDGDFPFTIGNIGASFTNKVVGCFRYTVTTGTYTLYTVLAPR